MLKRYCIVVITLLSFIACEKNSSEDQEKRVDTIIDTLDHTEVIDWVSDVHLSNTELVDLITIRALPTITLQSNLIDFPLAETTEEHIADLTFDLTIFDVPGNPADVDLIPSAGRIVAVAKPGHHLFKVYDKNDPAYEGIVTGMTFLFDVNTADFGLIHEDFFADDIFNGCDDYSTFDACHERIVDIKLDAMTELFGTALKNLELYKITPEHDTVSINTMFDPEPDLGIMILRGNMNCDIQANIQDIVSEYPNFIIDSPRDHYLKEE